MPIKYRLIERGEPGVIGGGTKKWYAIAVNDGEVHIDDLVAEIEKFSTLSEPDIKGVIVALENVIQKSLANGKIVRLEKLGSLYVTLSSRGTDVPEDFVARTLIEKVNIRYRTGKRINDSVRVAGFRRMP